MMTMGEWNDAKMDGLIRKIMTNWRPIGGPTGSNSWSHDKQTWRWLQNVG